MDQKIEQKLWEMADKLRNNIDPSEYKHVILGLLFLKYVSDRFLDLYNTLDEDEREEKDYYTAENLFFVPEQARWNVIQQNAKNAKIGVIIDEALRLIEDENPSLKGVLDKRYAKPDLSLTALGGIVDLVSNTTLYSEQDKDILGRVYEYFLGQFASKEGKGGGEFYTPACVVKTLVHMLEPFAGRVYDPCCGSGGMFVQSGHFIEEHAGRLDDISVYGQESNPTTWRLCKMNLAIRRIEANLGGKHADSFHNDLHRSEKFEFIMANPPFNISDWDGDKIKNDARWQFGTPPEGNANYAWLQHIYSHLSANGTAGVVLANGSLSSNTSNEGAIRTNMLEADCVDAIVALPTQLFYTTQIPVSLWILSKNKKSTEKFRSREKELLFIDARSLGTMKTRSLKELLDEDITMIAETYHRWRNINGNYEDIAGFCKSASLDDIRGHGYTLTPGLYVGTEDSDDGIDYPAELERLSESLKASFAESARLQAEIEKHLKSLNNA